MNVNNKGTQQKFEKNGNQPERKYCPSSTCSIISYPDSIYVHVGLFKATGFIVPCHSTNSTATMSILNMSKYVM